MEQQEQNKLGNNSRTTVVMTWKPQQCIWRRCLTLRRLLITLTLAVVASVAVVFYLLLTEDPFSSFTSAVAIVIHWRPPMAEPHNQNNVQPSNNDNRIFFHETSGRLELSFKETCAVESAALHNPQRPVQIFFQPQQQSTTAAIDQSSAWIRVLNRYANVQVIVIDDEALYFKDSPLEDWYREAKWRNSPYRVQHMADYIRMVTLKKGGGGGMYLDLDIVTLKPYDGPQFRNFVTAKNKQLFRITNAVFHLDGGHRLIDAIIKEQSDEYDPDDYVYNGPGAMSMAMTKLCNYSRGHLESNICRDVALLPHFLFHPIGGQSGHVYFMHRRGEHIGLVSTFIERMERLSYGAHIQNFMTRDLVVDTPSPSSSSSDDNNLTQVFGILAASHCPLTFAHRFQFQFL